MKPAMNVLVCVKQIPDPNAPGKLDPQTRRLVREGVDLVLDPGDEHGVEAGLQLVEKDAGEVTVISMGPPKALDAIRRALAMGAHRGILVTDPALENSDALSTARAIAAAIKDQLFEEAGGCRRQGRDRAADRRRLRRRGGAAAGDGDGYGRHQRGPLPRAAR